MTTTIAVRPLSKAAIRKRMNDVLRIHHPEVLERPRAFPLLGYIEEDLMWENFGFECRVGGPNEVPDHVLAFTDFSHEEVVLSEETYADLRRDDGRARFSMAHEIAHVILHTEQLRDMGRSVHGLRLNRNKRSFPIYQCPEWQADTGAAELLVPAKWIPDFGDPLSVSMQFGVSNQMAGIRLKESPAK